MVKRDEKISFFRSEYHTECDLLEPVITLNSFDAGLQVEKKRKKRKGEKEEVSVPGCNHNVEVSYVRSTLVSRFDLGARNGNSRGKKLKKVRVIRETFNIMPRERNRCRVVNLHGCLNRITKLGECKIEFVYLYICTCTW